MSDKIFNPFQDLLIEKSEIKNLVNASIKNRAPLNITYINQNCFNIGYTCNKYQKILLNDYKYFLDGIGMWFASKLISRKKIDRFNASELNEELFVEFKNAKIPLIIIGGSFSKSTLDSQGLNIELYLDGYEAVQDYHKVISKLTRCESKLIIIGLGVPKQEEFGHEISKVISNLQIICVGNFLEFYFGTKKRAPKFLHNSGLEWIFRLIIEPKRLWKRYIIGIPLFFYRIIHLKCNL